jgi:hypothetical protein
MFYAEIFRFTLANLSLIFEVKKHKNKNNGILEQTFYQIINLFSKVSFVLKVIEVLIILHRGFVFQIKISIQYNSLLYTFLMKYC